MYIRIGIFMLYVYTLKCIVLGLLVDENEMKTLLDVTIFVCVAIV